MTNVASGVSKVENLLHKVLVLGTVCVLATAAASAEGAEEKVLQYVTNWVGNTFEGSGPNGQGRWVQDYIDEIEVTPDGQSLQPLSGTKPGAVREYTRTAMSIHICSDNTAVATNPKRGDGEPQARQ